MNNKLIRAVNATIDKSVTRDQQNTNTRLDAIDTLLEEIKFRGLLENIEIQELSEKVYKNRKPKPTN